MTKDELDAMEKLAGALVKDRPLPWSVESEKCDGAYGSGEDATEGYHSFSIEDAKARRIADTLNTSDGEVHEEFNEDGCYAWDDVAKRICEAIVATVNALPELIRLARIGIEAVEAEKWFENSALPPIKELKEIEARDDNT
jgi:hypothetical protein